MMSVKPPCFCATAPTAIHCRATPPSLARSLTSHRAPKARARVVTSCARRPPRRGDSSAVAPAWQNALLINAVPLLWGSYAPVIKLLNQHAPHIPVLLLNFACFLCAQLCISAARVVTRDASRGVPLRVGIELGCYLYVGSLLNLGALSYTTAPRAAFLVQLTTVFVPLLCFARGALIESRVWQACALALSGALILSADGLSLSLNAGDVLALLSALFYSAHVLRLDEIAPNERTLPLVDAKTRTQFTLATLCALLFPQQALQYARDTSAGGVLLLALGALWVGGATTSAATCLQVWGQRRVGATRAAVFYASQPVWAALIALALRVDDMSVRELIGGGVIVAAGVFLALSRTTGSQR